MTAYSLPLQVNGSIYKNPVSDNFDRVKRSMSSTVKPFLKELQQFSVKLDVPKKIRDTSLRLLDAVVDSVFLFVDQPLLPSQSNFAPVEEIGEGIEVHCSEGKIPIDFPEGVYLRNGPNPLFGGLQSTISVFGRTSHTWFEGEGMLHALYLKKYSDGGWTVVYNNKHVQTETFKLEKQRNRPSFIPSIEGDSPAILAASLFNFLRFATVHKYICNTNIFEHSGKIYSIAENHLPQEIDILTLEALGDWDVNGAWNRPFTSHPKKVPHTSELVILGADALKPFLEVGVISADGNKLVHKVDLKLDRSILCHEIGVTERYNVVMDLPLTIDIQRLVRGGPLMKFDKDEYTRIAVFPRYGDTKSIKWFAVETCCMFHVLNCFEDGDEVVMRGHRSLESILPGPDLGLNKFEWFSRECKPVTSLEGDDLTRNGPFFSSCYEWRLNIKTGGVKEGNLTRTDFSMEFPMINPDFTGIKNKFGYTQIADSITSSTGGMAKFKGLAKLYFEEQADNIISKLGEKECDSIKVECHLFPENTFCSGAAFVSKPGGLEEDDGWIITYVHNEIADTSLVYIVDAKKFSGQPVAIITLPTRVPYGFHGAFVPKDLQNLK